jgi:hypothetical protein
VRLVKGARSVESERKNRSRGSRRNWRRLEKKKIALGRTLGRSLGDPRNRGAAADAGAGLPSKQEAAAGAGGAALQSSRSNNRIRESSAPQAAESQWDGRSTSAQRSCVRFLTLLGMSASQAACKGPARVSRTCIRVFARSD